MVMRRVSIKPVLNGFIVGVGCQTLVFSEIEDVAQNLIDYQKDPEGMEKKFIEAAVNKTMECIAPEPTVQTALNAVRFVEDPDDGCETAG